MKKEIPRASDRLSRKPKGFWAATFLLELFGVSCQEKEDPGNSGRKCEHINGRNGRFLASCNVAPWQSQKCLRKHKDSITGDSLVVSAFETSLPDKNEYFRRNESPP